MLLRPKKCYICKNIYLFLCLNVIFDTLGYFDTVFTTDVESAVFTTDVESVVFTSDVESVVFTTDVKSAVYNIDVE